MGSRARGKRTPGGDNPTVDSASRCDGNRTVSTARTSSVGVPLGSFHEHAGAHDVHGERYDGDLRLS